ncbi:MAG: dihydropteroate synthase [Candidatus Zixiibacteriota bacterium]|nr:MAG: dihydropteroate synthase [candidate division Zixibacteria bacterium]
MGVLNVTPDSFSDGGRFEDPGTAVNRALEMEQQGADIIDIGGESSRPGAIPVSAEQEWTRIGPVIEGIRSTSKVTLSVDTCKAGVAEAALDAGADIINDISALREDPKMVELVASRQVPVVLMHMLGTPATMQRDPKYDDCVSEINEFFSERVEACRRYGIDASRIILDPGVGFGKRVSDNLEILARLSEFKRFGLPLLVGTSRKSFIGMVHPTDASASERLGGSIASMITAVANGADIVRVHDVAETVEALKIVRAIKEGV